MPSNNTTAKKRFFHGTLYQWALASFAIVILPLILTIIYTVFEVTNFNEKSIQTLYREVQLAKSSRIALERLVSMERNIRQYTILNDPDLFWTFKENRQKFLDALDSQQKIAIALDQNLITQLKKLRDNENQFYQSIIKNLKNNRLKLNKNDLQAFDQLTKQAGALSSKGQQRIAIEANIVSAKSKLAKDKLIYSALASISFALILGFTFVALLSRPIKDLARAIRNLGDIGFEQPISIKGPHDLIELGEHLDWLRQKLNHVEYEKQQFIRNVSHELKTPLATLKEGTDLLAENVVGELNTEQQEIIQLMKIGNITIHDLVENLLEYQRTLSTQIEFNFSTFELNILINRVIKEYQLILKSKNITLDCNLNTASIEADYEKLKIIISNVFSNAVKYSPRNATIGLTLYYSKNIILLTIEDQGPGIAKEIKPHIFKAFYQGISPEGWKVKASGLGLALVKHYLEAHQGAVKLLPANDNYCGARFSLLLPRKQ